MAYNIVLLQCVRLLAVLQLRVDPGWFTSTGHSPHLVSVINSHLPTKLRVLTAALVCQSYSARLETQSRLYDYWLPINAVLPEHFSNSEDPVIISDALSRFRKTLALYVGMHEWHNFSLGRVRNQFVKHRNLGNIAPTGTGHRESDATLDVDAQDDCVLDMDGPESDAIVENESARRDESMFTRFYTSLRNGGAANIPRDWSFAPQVTRNVFHSDVSEPFDVIVHRDSASGSPSFSLRGSTHALDHQFTDVDDNDRSDKASFSAGIHPAASAGRVVRLSFHGNGFMARQIRSMVGAAVAVQRGLLQEDIIRAALTLPVCPNLPIAPPGGLVQVKITACLVLQ